MLVSVMACCLLGLKPLPEPMMTHFQLTHLDQLEQLERLRSEDTPRRLMITHTIGSQVKKIIDLELKTLQSRHDFQSQGQMTLKI